MNKFRIAVLLALTSTSAFLLSAAPAGAATGCTFTAPTATVTIDPGQSATIKRSGSAIQVNGANCGAATVSNTGKVIVNGSTGQETLTLDLTGGAFAPGAGAEATGAPEIEFEVNLSSGSSFTPDTVVVQGTGAADTYRLGSTGINLNNDDDSDVTGPAGGTLPTMSADIFKVYGGAGQDTISGAGAVNVTIDPVPYGTQMQLDGGDQNDMISGGNSDDTITGGPGADIMAGGEGTDTFLEDAAASGNDDISGGGGPYDTVDYSARMVGIDVSLDGLANDGQPGIELDNVRDDNEYFYFGSGNDTFLDNSSLYSGRRIYGGLGADHITGGTGGDVIYGCGPDDSHYRQYAGAQCNADGGDTLHGGAGGDTF